MKMERIDKYIEDVKAITPLLLSLLQVLKSAVHTRILLPITQDLL